MERPSSPRPRGPDDRAPSEAPCFLEVNAVRFELPVSLYKTPGLLVIRVFTSAGRLTKGGAARADDVEMSIRGKAALLLEFL